MGFATVLQVLVRGRLGEILLNVWNIWWAQQDSNLRPADYELEGSASVRAARLARVLFCAPYWWPKVCLAKLTYFVVFYTQTICVWSCL